MAVSKEFTQAVQERNYLRVRIMLKDSLLIDKTFNLFSEMQSYASSNGADPWMDSDIPLEKAAKPWTEDTMNYELTALVNDFTKDHADYVKKIISEVYTVNTAARSTSQARSAQNRKTGQSNSCCSRTGGSLYDSDKAMATNKKSSVQNVIRSIKNIYKCL